ncbi:MAG: cytochrome c3 family protein [Deltaproteobacteria bacterium]|nr:cytochrome c3 family protein [Deltaproteobacteria bacterium]
MPAPLVMLALVGAVDPSLWSGPPPAAGAGWCASCHLVQIGPVLSRPVRDAARGVHYEKGVFCRDCHGGDAESPDSRAAKRSGTGFIGAPGMMLDEAAFCGRCHERELASWRSSGHNQPTAKSQEPSDFVKTTSDKSAKSQQAVSGRAAGCVTCHGSHAAKKASTDLINPKNCAGCHGYPESNALKTHIMQATTAILSTREQIRRFRASGGGAFAEEADLERLRGPLEDLYHMTDRGNIRRTTQQIREESARISGRVKWLESGKTYRERIRWVWVAAAFTGAFVAAYHFTVAFRMKKMLKRGRQSQ